MKIGWRTGARMVLTLLAVLVLYGLAFLCDVIKFLVGGMALLVAGVLFVLALVGAALAGFLFGCMNYTLVVIGRWRGAK